MMKRSLWWSPRNCFLRNMLTSSFKLLILMKMLLELISSCVRFYQIIKLALASASNPKIASSRLLPSLGDESNSRVDITPTHV